MQNRIITLLKKKSKEEKSFFWTCSQENDYSIEFDDSLNFASVVNDEIIAVFSCIINYEEWQIENFFTVLFNTNKTTTFTKDIVELINTIFENYEFNKIKLFTIADNPFRNVVERWVLWQGGRKIGYLEQEATLSDGLKHDVILFEIMKKTYINRGKHE